MLLSEINNLLLYAFSFMYHATGRKGDPAFKKKLKTTPH
jgi:hypothetical protein